MKEHKSVNHCKSKAGRELFDRSLTNFMKQEGPDNRLREFHNHPFQYTEIYNNLKAAYSVDYYDEGLKHPAPLRSDVVQAGGIISDKVADAAIDIADGTLQKKMRMSHGDAMIMKALKDAIHDYRILISFYYGEDRQILLKRWNGESRCEIAADLGISEAAIAKRLSRINKNFYNVAKATLQVVEQDV